MSVYYPSRVVVMGQCPSGDGSHPMFGAGPSQSASRMDSLCHDWRQRALGANAWWQADDQVCDRPSHVQQILEETGCSVVVALGAFVQRELGLSPKTAVMFGSETIGHAGRDVLVIRFPHPSGRNRYWNSQRNREEAAQVLRGAFS